MKKTLFLLFTLFLCSCSSDEKETPELTWRKSAQEKLEKAGLKPAHINDITELYWLEDSVEYKVAVGNINKKENGKIKNLGWLAKFDSQGNELFSYTIDPTVYNYAFCQVDISSGSTFVLLDGDIAFIKSKLTNNMSSFDYDILLTVINFNSGEELSKLPFSNDRHAYEIIKNNCVYYILDAYSNYKTLSCLDLNGKLQWTRDCTSSERKSGLNAYSTFNALDNERLIFYTYNSAKIINLKTYTELLDISFYDIPMTGEHSTEENVFYQRSYSRLKNDNLLNLYYSEKKQTLIIDDPITNETHYESELLNTYFYQCDLSTGKITGPYME